MRWVIAIGVNSWGLAALLPLVFASALMPIRTLVSAHLSRPGQPLGSAFAFLAANWVWRVLLGAAVLSALGFDPHGFARIVTPGLGAIATMAALGFIAAALLEWRRPQTFAFSNVDRWVARLDGLGPRSVFFATLAVSWWPGTQWLFVLAGTGVIQHSGFSPGAQAVVLGLFTASQLVLVATPIALGRAVKHDSDAFDRAETWVRERVGSGIRLKLTMGAVLGLIALGIFTGGLT